MNIDEIIKTAWYDGNSMAHDTKRDYQITDDFENFKSSYDDEINNIKQANAETSTESVKVCVNCDKAKEAHYICADCLTKIINENKQTL